MIDSKYYVYEWFIVETKEVFYVGKGCENRVASMKNRNNYFKNIRKKYKCDYRILKYFNDENEAYDFELKRGMELKEIGQAKACYVLGNFKRFIDDSVLEKMKKTQFKKGNSIPWNKGKHLSKEMKLKLSEAHKGNIQTEETKKKRSESLKGHKVSEKTINALVKMRSKKVAKINPCSLQIENEYNSASEVAREYNVSLATISNKCTKHLLWKGFYFEYIEHDNPESV